MSDMPSDQRPTVDYATPKPSSPKCMSVASIFRGLVWVISTCVLLAVLLWLRMYLPVHYEPVQNWGNEFDATSRVLRSIDLQRSYHVTGWMPDVEGGHQTRIVTNHYYLNQPGMPRKELKFLPTLEEGYIDGEFLPVAGTSAWVMKTNPHLLERVILTVFNGNGVLHKREIQVSSSSSQAGLDYRFTNGNATMQFTYLGKSGSYDVMADKFK